MSRWSDRSDVPRGHVYDQRWKALEEAGGSVHGEADLLEALWSEYQVAPGRAERSRASFLDAGCGTGRVAIELARRGFDVVGVDLDSAMLATALEKAPRQHWVHADLVDVQLEHPSGSPRKFDVIGLAGNVMIFLAPGTEGPVLQNLGEHLAPGGLLVAGFQLKPERLDLGSYDAACAGVGLELEGRWSTWDRQPFVAGGSYAVSAHARSG